LAKADRMPSDPKAELRIVHARELCDTAREICAESRGIRRRSKELVAALREAARARSRHGGETTRD
jgi:hypothetical protein